MSATVQIVANKPFGVGGLKLRVHVGSVGRLDYTVDRVPTVFESLWKMIHHFQGPEGLWKMIHHFQGPGGLWKINNSTKVVENL